MENDVDSYFGLWDLAPDSLSRVIYWGARPLIPKHSVSKQPLVVEKADEANRKFPELLFRFRRIRIVHTVN